MIGQRRPSAGSAAGRRSRHFRSDSNAISEHSSAATQTHAVWPMISSSGPGAPRPSTKPAGGRPSANCCRPPSTSTAPRSRHSIRSARLRGMRRAYLGKLDGANLIKLHRQSGKVSYLVYPDFETDPHPALLRSVKLSLRTREIDCFDYTASSKPAGPASQGDVSDGRSSAARQVRPVDPARGKARLAGRHGDDRDEGRLAGTAQFQGIRAAGHRLVRRTSTNVPKSRQKTGEINRRKLGMARKRKLGSHQAGELIHRFVFNEQRFGGQWSLVRADVRRATQSVMIAKNSPAAAVGREIPSHLGILSQR